MAANYWAKVWIEMIDDRKTATLPDSSWRRFIECILLAKELNEGGYLPPVVDMAFRLRLNEQALADDLTRLALAGLLELKAGDRWYITNFEKRQSAMPSTERSRRSRAAPRAQHDTPKSEGANTWRTRIYKGIPNTSGIYMISFPASGQAYIGSSKDMYSRVKVHLSEITDHRHAMYPAFQTCGEDGISAHVLEVVPEERLSERETYWIKSYSGTVDLLNKEKVGKAHRDRDDVATIRCIETETETETEGEKITRAPATANVRAVKNPPPPPKVQTQIQDRTPSGFRASSGYKPPDDPGLPAAKEPSAELRIVAEISDAVTEVTGVSAKLNRQEMYDLASDLHEAGYTAEQIRVHYGPRKVAERWHWYETDWRGKRGDRPRLREIRETIAGAVMWRPAEQLAQENGGQSWVERSIELARRNGLLPQPGTGQLNTG